MRSAAGGSLGFDQPYPGPWALPATLRALAEQGVLIAVASKNDPDVVEAAFQRNDILFPRQKAFPMEVNWKPKSESVARILRAWNVGPTASCLWTTVPWNWPK